MQMDTHGFFGAVGVARGNCSSNQVVFGIPLAQSGSQLGVTLFT